MLDMGDDLDELLERVDSDVVLVVEVGKELLFLVCVVVDFGD